MMNSAKPPVPAGMFDPFPRIGVDTSDGSPFQQILRIGLSAAHDWTLGSNGPYKQLGMAPATVTRMELTEALLHLLELGFIDIDVERLQSAPGWPMQRERRGQNPEVA